MLAAMTKSSYIFALAAMTIFPGALSSPTQMKGRTSSPGTAVTADFNDLAARPFSLPTVGNNVPNPYRGIYFEGWNVQSLNSPETLLTPHSEPNAAGTGPISQLTDGGGPAFIRTAGYSCYDLVSIWLGCIANTEGNLNTPIGCTIEFTGQVAATGAFVSQLVSFIPDTLLGNGSVSLDQSATMQEGIFGPGFKGLVAVNLTIVDSSLLPALTALYIDDVGFILHS